VRREHIERLLWLAGLVALTAFAIWLRRQGGTTAAPDGDESLYFALSRDLGRAEPPAFAQHVIARPFFYVFWHLPAQVGLETVQLLHEILSGLVPLATVAVARALGHGRIAALLGGLAVAVHAPSIHFSWTFFPDTTATLLATLGAAAYLRGRWVVALLLLTAGVATKELVAVVPLALLPLGIVRPLRGSHVLWAAVAAVAAVATITWWQAHTYHNVQGWGGGDLSPRFLAAMGWSLDFVPIGVLLVVGVRWRELGLALAYPAFFVLWVLVRERGVNAWYLPCVAPFLGLAISGAADVASRARPWFLRAAAVALFAIFLGTAPWREGLARARQGRDRNDAAVAAAAEVRLHHPRTLGLFDTFWAYNRYPFDLAPEVHGIWTNGLEDGLARARMLDVVVLEEQKGNQALRDRLAPCGRRLGHFWVYAQPARCAQ
jgi:hypothetical protein